jgi:uncharacterized NAD-dependent epimerase/dehydratase family protein
MEDAAARKAIDETAKLTGLPTTDVIRYGAEPLAEAVRMFFGW